MKTVNTYPPFGEHLPVFPRFIVEHLLDRGFSDATIFDDLGFTKQDLSREDFRLDPTQHARLIRHAMQLTGNRHLALEMKDRAFDATSTAVLLLFKRSGRISKALHLISRYNYLYTRTLTARLLDMDAVPTIEVDCHISDTEVAYFALSTFLLFIDTFFQDTLEGRHLVSAAEFAISEPMGFADISDQFGVDIQFGAPATRFFLDPSLVDEPLRSADPQTMRLITDFCEKQLANLDAERGLESMVTALIMEHISAPPSLDQAATMLSIAPRSLRRHLQASGTSYTSILSSARRDIAIKLLRETDETVAAIAYEVGFEHPSHFGRAFKQWTGYSPTRFRAD